MNKYNIIYADPPWSYNNKRTGGSMISGADSKYQTIPTKELCTLPIYNILEDDAVLFLWSTNPFLPDAFKVMESWGFKYKTMITWKKNNNGMGFWFRSRTEHLLLGVKGKIKCFRCQEPNFIEHKILRHSEKPEAFRKLIEKATANIDNPKKVELFARQKIDGWDVVGYDVDEIRIEEFLNKG
jgi:site-specific DNA-methyltransferase (adenine-specific)